MMICYKDTIKPVKSTTKEIERSGVYKKLLPFFSVSVATPLLVAFFFYNDALVTVTNNFAIYWEQVLELANSQKSLILMLIIIMNAIGAVCSGRIGDTFGIKKTLIGALISRIIVLPLFALTSRIEVVTILVLIL
jgi:MFS-type transporter involved in bile tolerance (Atg22 family)